MSDALKLLEGFESKAPEIVFEWNDVQTNAKGWVVINSLRGGAAGGGTRMRKGLTRHEVTSLAKTMEVKFSVCGPAIGGAKSGIDFDPSDPRKSEVLSRWYKAVSPLLKFYYGTGGDMNVDEIEDVVPLTEKYGLWHPQEGIVNGHYAPSKSEKIKKIGQLRIGVPSIIANQKYTPDVERKYTVSDMITGYGVAQSVVHYYNIWGGDLQGKSALIQGWGNVGAAAGFFLVKAGVKIKGIMDKSGVLINETGFTEYEIEQLFNQRVNRKLTHDNVISFKEGERMFWNQKVDIFLPCAGSRLVSKDHAINLINSGCELISSGANVPFNNPEILFGKLHQELDQKISVIPDFIANCGMARTFAYLMQNDSDISSEAIFHDVSQTIFNALSEVFKVSESKMSLSETALEIAIKKLV